MTLAEELPSTLDPILLSANQALVDEWPRRKGQYVRHRGSFVTNAFEWIRALRNLELNPDDVVVLWNLQLIWLAVWLKIARKRRPAILLDLHDWLPRWIGRAKLRLLVNGCDQAVAVSHHVASQIPHFARTVVLYRPIKIEKPNARIRSPLDKVRIGVVGRVDSDKNIELVLALAVLEPNWSFGVYGEISGSNQEYIDGLRSAAKDLKNVVWHGLKDASEIYSEIDVLLATKPFEALGRGLLEAKVCGIPIVGPNTGGFAEIQSQSSSGRTYESNDVASAHSALVQILNSHEEPFLEKDEHYWSEITHPSVYAEQYAVVISEVRKRSISRAAQSKLSESKSNAGGDMGTSNIMDAYVSVTLNYNNANLTVEAVSSVLAQQPRPSRVFVVDNGSQTEDRHTLKQRLEQLSEHVSVIYLERNFGVAGGLVEGLMQISREVELDSFHILLQHNDTYLEAGAIAPILVSLADRKYAAIGLVQVEYHNPERILYAGGTFALGPLLPRHRLRGAQRASLERRPPLARCDWLDFTAVVFRRGVLGEVGLPNGLLIDYWEDLVWSCQASRNGYSLAVHNRAFVRHIVGATLGTGHNAAFFERRARGRRAAAHSLGYSYMAATVASGIEAAAWWLLKHDSATAMAILRGAHAKVRRRVQRG